jgi:hypothetical protein
LPVIALEIECDPAVDPFDRHAGNSLSLFFSDGCGNLRRQAQLAKRYNAPAKLAETIDIGLGVEAISHNRFFAIDRDYARIPPRSRLHIATGLSEFESVT